jgi:hypothetical protein
MLKILFSPKWFYGKDILIDIFSIIVLTLIATFSFKYYKINKNKNHLWFSVSFGTLAIAFFFKILTNFTIYYQIIDTKTLGFLTFSYKTIQTSDVLFTIGFLFYIFLSLISLFILYEIYQKKHSRQNIFLFLFFITTTTYFTTSKYFLFHLTAFYLLFLITKNYTRNEHSKILTIAFFIITASQLFFIFVNVNPVFYVIAETIQFMGYFLLLTTFIGVIKNA